MITLFKENETKFNTLGIGVLSDATICMVAEGLNDSFELELEYPISGQHYSEIKIDSIIFAKYSPTADPQPFRVAEISKPLNGMVKIKALHISYDMNGVIIKPLSADTLVDLLHKLETETILEHHFKFHTDVNITKTYKTSGYYNLRSLLFGSEDSILETYELEIYFDNFDVYLTKKRGSNKNAQIRYGKNMTELEHDFSCDLLYNYVYPYYHAESKSKNVKVTEEGFKQAYIVGKIPLVDGWLSFEKGGEPYHPVDEAPVQIATDGDYKDRIFSWDSKKQKYKEKLYEQQVTLVEGVTAPEWIEIDWSGLPSLVVRAKKDGYFKMMTDSEYKFCNIGDIVFSGSIRSSLLNNLILYYSEVIPSTNAEIEDDTVSVEHIELTEKLMKVDTELANKMTFNRILNLNLTSEFEDDEKPDEAALKEKALKFIKENKIGEYKYNTTVSFADLSSTSEDVIYKNLESISLGDTVKVVYERLNVDVELRVIKTTYDALTDRYDSVELGEKSDTISSSSVQSGDNVSSLKNDKGYANEEKVSEIIAKTITADYIQAVNAKLSRAQIEELSATRIKIGGMLEASQAEIDNLVAKMLTAENAVIKKTLEAGEVKVSGDITVKSGEISIESEDGTKSFRVDRDGNLEANSAIIRGRIEASEGVIGGFIIGQTSIYNNIESMASDNEDGVYIGSDGISLGKQLKIYPNGLITSYTPQDTSTSAQLSIPEEIKTPTRYLKSANSFVYPGTLIGCWTISQLSSLTYNQVEVGYTFNVADSGTITNGDGTELELVKGNNIVVDDIIEVESVYVIMWRMLNEDEFNAVYHYIDSVTPETIQGFSTTRIENELKPGDTYRILETRVLDNVTEYDPTHTYHRDDLCIHEGIYYRCYTPSATGAWNPASWRVYDTTTLYALPDSDGTSTIFEIGDLAMLVTDPDDNTTWRWDHLYTANLDDNYFGITPEGILYANGAIIKGDITVKSGEISIESADGSKVFRVDREGNLEANSATIKGHVEATSGKIANLSVYNTYLRYVDTNSQLLFEIKAADKFNPSSTDLVPTVGFYSYSARFDYLLLPSEDDAYNNRNYSFIDYKGVNSRGLVSLRVTEDSTQDNFQIHSRITPDDMKNIPIMPLFYKNGIHGTKAYFTDFNQMSVGVSYAPRIHYLNLTNIPAKRWNNYDLSGYLPHAIVCAVACHRQASSGGSYLAINGNVSVKWSGTTLSVATNTESAQSVSVIIIGY